MAVRITEHGLAEVWHSGLVNTVPACPSNIKNYAVKGIVRNFCNRVLFSSASETTNSNQ